MAVLILIIRLFDNLGAQSIAWSECSDVAASIDQYKIVFHNCDCDTLHFPPYICARKACISCHTSLPYALVEPLLPGQYAAYTDLIQNIEERVRTWQVNTPWYSDEKAELAAELGGLPKDALKANLGPWEVEDSDLWGSSLACIAASQYPKLAPPENLELLYSRLRRGAVDSNTSLHVKAAILWCDSEIDGTLIEAGVAKKIVAELFELQHSNGAWAIRELGPWGKWEGSPADCCAQLEIRTDAYATGFITLVLARNLRLVSDKDSSRLSRAVTWITKELQNPYPAEPRINRHESASEEFPQFRNNIYTNAGHMWAFLAKTVYENRAPPWVKRISVAPIAHAGPSD